MKKISKIISIALALLMIFAFASCGKESSDYSKYVKLGEYKGLTVDEVSVEVTSAELQSAIDAAIKAKATRQEITDRGVQDGDIAIVDYKGFINGEQFEGGTAENYEIIVGKTTMIDGFVEGIMGVKAGDSVSLDLTFPEDYYEDLAGKPVKFDITVKKIEVETLPEYNDEFCKTLGYNSKDEYETALKANLLSNKQNSAKLQMKNQVWAAIVENCEIKEYPESKVNEYVKKENETFESYAKSVGVSLEEFLSTYYGMTKEEFDKEILAMSQSYVSHEMILRMIAKAEGMEVTDEEYKAEVAAYAAENNMTESEFEEYYGRDVIVSNILWEEVTDFAIENAAK